MYQAHLSITTIRYALLSLICIVLALVLSLVLYELQRNKKPKKKNKKITSSVLPERHVLNPIITPDPSNEWEAGGTFNPAAWHDETGKVHLVYRAVGSDGVSRLGYAESVDGENFLKLNYPIFVMENPRCIQGRNITDLRFDPVMYPSGGSYGGAEDPRMVSIEDRIYISCSAFDGWDYIRIAVFSIKIDDFVNKRWKWSKTMLISPEGEIHKNWVLFPEKIHGKFAILHSINPKIQIDYVEHLEDLDRGHKKITSVFSQSVEKKGWDTKMRGVGAPPVKTKFGWLVLYHATDNIEPHKYKVGAMMLDIHNPDIILARSPAPLLVPDMWYENDWKPGVVYVCGAVIEQGTLYIYYGGGDKHVCVAEVPEDNLLTWLMGDHKA